MAINTAAAIEALKAEGIDINAEFHALKSSQAAALAALAKAQGYRAPKNASGSTARYFFAALQRKHNGKR